MEAFVQDLHEKGLDNSKVLTEGDPKFELAHQRWTDIDRKVPAVIVQPTNEHDIAKVVCWIILAVHYRISVNIADCAPL